MRSFEGIVFFVPFPNLSQILMGPLPLCWLSVWESSLPANLQDHFHANLGRETRSEVLLILCKLSFSNTIVSILISDLYFIHPGNNWELPFSSIGAEGVVEIRLLSHIKWNKIISNLVWLQQFTCFFCTILTSQSSHHEINCMMLHLFRRFQ